MKVKFWGVRGSIPAPGPDTNRYGGNTACVSVRTSTDALIIIDMGTGLVNLGNALMSAEFGKGHGRAAVLLSHTHWDHIQGFPFFPPVFVPGNQLAVYGAARSPSLLEGILEGQMNPHFSPIYTLKNLGASIEFVSMPPGGCRDVAGIMVCSQPNPHGTTESLAFRLCEAGRSVVYASDVGYPPDGPSDAVLELYRGANVLIHDTTYTVADRQTRIERGFSSFADAAAVAVRAEVERLVMFHYDQDYTDDEVDALRDACRAELDRLGGEHIELIAAAEGLELEV